jgi:hypothetical protein
MRYRWFRESLPEFNLKMVQLAVVFLHFAASTAAFFGGTIVTLASLALSEVTVFRWS